MRLWHNPRCSTSRKALELLSARGIEPELRLYLEDPPTGPEVEDLIAKLSLSPHDLLRTKEPEYAELRLSPTSSQETIVRAIASHPRLLERPILVRGMRAAIGRPVERIIEILD